MRGLFTEKILARTVVFLLLTEFLWGLGNYFVLMSTTIPAYLQGLGASPFVIGVMATAMGALMVIPQFFGRTVIERFPRRKQAIIVLHLLYIATYLAIPFLDRLLGARYPGRLIAVVIVLLGFSQLIMGLVVPVWIDMVAQVVPTRLRGIYFGLGAACFAGGGILGGLGLQQAQRWLGPDALRDAFCLAGACFVASMVAFSLAPVPPSAFAHPPAPPLLTRLRAMVQACHPRTTFGRLVLSYTVFTLAAAIIPFLITYALAPTGLHYPREIVGRITLWQALGGAVGGLCLGVLVDRLGSRLPWVLIIALLPAIVLLYPFGGWQPAWFTPRLGNLPPLMLPPPLLFIPSLFAGILNTQWSVFMPAVLDLSPSGDKSTFIATANMASLLPVLLGPLAIGGLIERAGFPTAFVTAGVISLAALAIALTLRHHVRTPHAPRT